MSQIDALRAIGDYDTLSFCQNYIHVIDPFYDDLIDQTTQQAARIRELETALERSDAVVHHIRDYRFTIPGILQLINNYDDARAALSGKE